jgi:signal transduction histidine kinase
MATASPFDAAVQDVLERLYFATSELDRFADSSDLAEKAAGLARDLTRSNMAIVALGRPGEHERVFSQTAEAYPPVGERDAAKLLASARAGSRTAAAADLRAGGHIIGTVVVVRTSDYSETERQALSIFASTVAARLDSAGSLRIAERVEHAHEQAVQVLTAVSSHAAAGQSLNDFYRRLATTVGELVGAGKVLFWRLGEDSMLAPIAGGFGIDPEFVSKLRITQCTPDGEDLGSRVVYHDMIFLANAAEPAEFRYVLEALGVSNAIAVPWRAGDERLGTVGAYDSTRPEGFSREDTWVLQKAGLAAGLVTLLWHAQEDLRKSVERLTKVDSARQMLVKNMTTVVEKERKRFVSELHDDALQKLTAAELQVARLAPEGKIDQSSMDRLKTLLEETESALRRLVFEVRPPKLESPDGLAQSIKDRVAMLAASGIAHELAVDLSGELSQDLKSTVFRQVAEAIGNVERHSKATRVKVSVSAHDGGVLGVVEDDGQGFVVAERSNLPGHLGLLALRERALMAGGRYKIESRPGAGTRIEFWLPLEQ